VQGHGGGEVKSLHSSFAAISTGGSLSDLPVLARNDRRVLAYGQTDALWPIAGKMK
jgi:hypothetical protein